MATKKKVINSKRPKSFAHSRPPNFSKLSASSSSLSSKVTRQKIRYHHQLQKQHAAAIAKGDDAAAKATAAQIEREGGLEAYQQASLTGQSNERGGDSSRVLMEWLQPVSDGLTKSYENGKQKLKLLEVGALSTSNASTRSKLFEVTRIDLNSQDKGILKQDFMERPLPSHEDNKFDVLCLSLVLNYVPDALSRGEMLRRTTRFLKENNTDMEEVQFCPALFLVLPAPCLSNSRYLDDNRLRGIMTSLGYSLLQRKVSAKLDYSLWKFDAVTRVKTSYKKVEVRSGHLRNNFSIILG
ncbi:MAG: 60S ribosomal protein L25 [Chaenotheca gracillima]|nr:MAG: 60S ribosomal protein L25 [Chaenotheca gracillima]